MSATEALKAARAAGIELGIDGDDLVLEASAPPPPGVIDLLSRHKAEIVSQLRSADEGWSDGRVPAAAPRFSRAQHFDMLVGAEAQLVDARALLDPAPTAADRAWWAHAAAKIVGALGLHPRGEVSPERWQQLLADVQRFVGDGLAHRARSLGWDELELFGVDRVAPWARVDRMGLVLLLKGSRVTWLTDQRAYIETPNGARQTYRRVPLDREHVVLIDQIERSKCR